jgi:hypothetical protein
MMDTRAKVEVGLGILFLACTAFGFSQWLAEHDDKIQAQATVAAQKEVFDKAAEQIKSIQQADAERDKQTAATIAQLSAAASAQKTPQQIASWIPQQVPGLPQPITINVPPSTPANPTPNAVASIPQVDLPKLRDTIENCQANYVLLTSCRSDVASRDSQIKILKEQTIPSIEKERDGYKDALKGGTFFTRVKRAGKWLAIGGLAGAAALCGSGHCR